MTLNIIREYTNKLNKLTKTILWNHFPLRYLIIENYKTNDLYEKVSIQNYKRILREN